ncbi:MAG: 50S ribosomal protein L18 [Acidobacteriia bacterium]|nr:50S ribosomal protein L18 [Terriglobia bacterium]
MIQRTNKNEIRGRIHTRIRRKVHGTPERPRLAVFRSLTHIYAQIIDDTKSQTLVSASSTEEGLRDGASTPAPAAAPPKADPPKADKGEKKGGKKPAPAPAPAATKASGGNVAGARLIGTTIAQRAKEKGIKAVVFDRGGYIYHGRLKALADAARKAGLEF